MKAFTSFPGLSWLAILIHIELIVAFTSSSSTSSIKSCAQKPSTSPFRRKHHSAVGKPMVGSIQSTSTILHAYTPPEASEAKARKKPPYPKIGDLVRYYDLDGGKSDGEELVGKLTFLQKSTSSKSNGPDGEPVVEWLAEVTELENVGEGYFAEYPSRKRRKSKLYKLESLSPVIGSYVRSEDAFKVPTDRMGKVLPLFESYNLEGFQGPAAVPVNTQVIENDLKNYKALKGKLFKDALLAGLFGTIIADLVAGLDIALVYFVGAISGVGYLFFLSVKTDTVASPDAKLGSNVSNIRFVLPLLVLVGISFQNLVTGGVSPSVDNVFDSVTKEQFGAAMLGFLTYRLPLFVSQLFPIIGESAGIDLPGSAGIAMQMARDAKESMGGTKKKDIFGQDLTTVLLVSGPTGCGKSELVEKLIQDSDGRFVAPKYLDRIVDPIKYEQLEFRDELLQQDPTGRYGLTKDSLLNSPGKFKDQYGQELDKIVVIDADVELCKKLTKLSGIRIVGVWVGLDALEKFEVRIKEQIESGAIPIPEGESAEIVRRTKLREIVKDIEYGIVSGIFEFTVLNDDFENSLMELKSAAEYCYQ
jgi:Guanylate kinase